LVWYILNIFNSHQQIFALLKFGGWIGNTQCTFHSVVCKCNKRDIALVPKKMGVDQVPAETLTWQLPHHARKGN